MHEPHTSALLGIAIAGAGLTAVLEHAALALFGIPLAAVTAAMTGGLVPTLLLDREPLKEAVLRWLGSVAFALISTGAVMAFAKLDPKFAIAVAGGLSAFARDLVAIVRGQLPPLITAVRERIAGANRKEGS